jgi:hypothetical protein
MRDKGDSADHILNRFRGAGSRETVGKLTKGDPTMKRMMSIATIALFVAGTSVFACDTCGCKAKKAAEKTCTEGCAKECCAKKDAKKCAEGCKKECCAPKAAE